MLLIGQSSYSDLFSTTAIATRRMRIFNSSCVGPILSMTENSVVYRPHIFDSVFHDFNNYKQGLGLGGIIMFYGVLDMQLSWPVY